MAEEVTSYERCQQTKEGGSSIDHTIHVQRQSTIHNNYYSERINIDNTVDNRANIDENYK